MNEAVWLSGTDPLALLLAMHPHCTHGSEKPQTRQSRMYLLACARRQWHQLPAVCRAIVALTEVYSDSPREMAWLRSQVAPIAEQLMHCNGDTDELTEAEAELSKVQHISTDREAAFQAARASDAPLHTMSVKPAEWRELTRLIYLPFESNTPAYHWVPSELHSLPLLHEVYGNPYRRITFSPSWRTDTAFTLARQMYESRDFHAMPILADALQDAGCHDEAILEHCRDAKQEHVRGCWVVDLVLKLR